MRNSKSTHPIVSERFTKIFASVIIVISLLVLIGWYSGLLFLTRFSINEVPMAPSTAYVFIFLASGLWFYLRPQKIARNRNTTIASAITAICLSCLVVIENIVKYYTNWEHAFIKIPQTHLSMELGHMSLVTAFLFIISGFAMLFLLSNKKIVKTFSSILTLILFIFSFILTLGYVFGTPFFYFDSFIPPAVLTALSFLLVSLGLIASSDKNTFLIKSIWKTSTGAKLLRVFLPITITITVVESFVIIRILPLFDIQPAIGISVLSLIFLAVVIVVISIISKSMGKTLDAAEEALQKYKYIVSSSTDMLAFLDKNYTYLTANKEYLKAFGLTTEKLTGKTVAKVFGKDFFNSVIKPYADRCLGGEEVNYQDWFDFPSTGKCYMDINYHPYYADDKQILGFVVNGRNITERKRSDAALLESKERFHNFFASSPGIIAIYKLKENKRLEIIQVNPMLAQILGRNLDTIVGKTFEEVFPSKADTEIPARFLAVALGGQAQTFMDHYTEENLSIWTEVNVFPMGKNTIGVVSIDTTKRKKAEEELQISNEKYLNLMDSLGTGVVLHAPDTNIVLSNPKSSDILGISPEQMKGKKAIDPRWRFVRNDGSDMPLEEYPVNKALSLMKSFSDYSIGIKRPDRKYITWVNVNASLVFDENNKIKYVTISYNDTTEQKQAEQALKESEARFRVLHNASFGGIAIHDKGLILDCNQGLSEISGYKVNDLIGMDGLLLIAEESREMVMENILAEYEKSYETIGIKKNGEKYPLRLEAKMIPYEGKKTRVVEFRDITELKRTESEIVKAKEKAEESDRLKSAFLSNMSHEIRTPMNGILGFINLLNEPNLSKSQISKYSTIINKSGDRLLNTINDIIDISKIEAGEVLISKSETSINNEIEELYAFFSPEANKKGLSLVLKPSKDTEQLKAITDSHKLHGVLTNLIKNAIKYTEKGQITFGYSIKGDFIEFFVKDTGIGIPKDRLQAIFNRFEQADIEDKKAFQGSGLGLAITKAYLDMLGGEISVESEEDKGSKFIFTIPYVKKTEKKVAAFVENINIDPKKINELNLLIVEDDDISLELLKSTLEGIFKNISIVDNGKDAIETCRDNPELDLVLMDLKIPIINGYDATKEIRKFNKDLIIIAQTAYAMQGDKEKAMKYGCNDYISKPINKILLLEIINKLLNP